jgi:hypothetical protein
MSLSDDIRARTRIVRTTEQTVRDYLAEALVRIQAILAGQPSDATRWQLSSLRVEIQRVLEQMGAQAGVAAAGQHAVAAEAGAVMVSEALARSGVRYVVPRIDAGQLLAMREFTTSKIAGVGLAAVEKINTELGLAMIGTQSPFEAAQRITEILKEESVNRAVRIVRTELGRAYSVAAHERMAQFAQVVPGLKKRWVKSGKLYPREHHAAIDGQVQAWNAPFKLAGGVRLMYPHDPAAPASEVINCGCLSVPVVPKA